MSLSDTYSRLCRVFRELIAEHLRNNKGSILKIFIFSLLGAASQAAAIYLISNSFEYIQPKYPESTDNQLTGHYQYLFIIAATLLAVLILGAIAIYRSILASRKLARQFHQFCASKILSSYHSRFNASVIEVVDSEAKLRQLVIRDSIHAGKALEVLAQLQEPILRVLLIVLIIIYLNAFLGLLTVVLILITVPLFFKQLHSVQLDSKKYYAQAVTEMGQNVVRLVSQINKTDLFAVNKSDMDIEALYLNDGKVKQYYDQFDRIQLARQRVQLWAGLCFSIVVIAGFLLSVSLALRGNLSWGVTLAYFLAIWQLTMAMRTLLGYVTSLGIYYPALFRIEQFFNRIKRGGDNKNSVKPVNTITFHAVSDHQLCPVVMAKGDMTYVVCDRNLSLINIPYVVSILSGCTDIPESTWLFKSIILSSKSLQANQFLSEQQCQDAQLISILEKLDLIDEFNTVCLQRQEKLTINDFTNVDIRLVLLVYYFANDPRQIYFIEAQLLDKLHKSTEIWLKEFLCEKFMFVFGMQPRFYSVINYHGLIVDKQFIGIGLKDWLEKNKEKMVTNTTSSATELDDDILI